MKTPEDRSFGRSEMECLGRSGWRGIDRHNMSQLFKSGGFVVDHNHPLSITSVLCPAFTSETTSPGRLPVFTSASLTGFDGASPQSLRSACDAWQPVGETRVDPVDEVWSVHAYGSIFSTARGPGTWRPEVFYTVFGGA